MTPLKVCAVALLFAVAPANADEAKDILQATGVQGGLVVHLGCGSGKLTAALHVHGGFLVQGLDAKAENVEAARRYIQSLGLYGPVSIQRWTGDRLPYVDNLVNLIVADGLGKLPMPEVLRVLAPNGVAWIGGKKTVKPWPEDIDEWSHFLHGPDNNAVARDRVVGPPARLQWLAAPIHLRSHEHLNSLSALVSAGGRIFYIIDEGPTSAVVAPPAWRLVARDAFNGILLWKQPLGPWEGHFRLFRSGPPEIARRLVAVGNRVYVTRGYGKEVAAFDAATGEQVMTYPETKGALEIVVDDGRLFVVTGDIDLEPPADAAKRFYPPMAPKDKGLVVADAASGKALWKRKDADTESLMPTTLAAAHGRVFLQNTRQVVCLDALSGKEKWRADRPVFTQRLSWSAPTLVVADGVVLSADGSTIGLKGRSAKGENDVTWILSDADIRKHPVGDLVAFDADDGKLLWSGTSLQGFCNPGDVFVVDDKVWAGADVGTGQALMNTAVDLKTGKVLSRRPKNGMMVAGHTRCYRSKATERYLLLGDVGVDFVDLKDWSWNASPWVRGTCQYGVMPCNGLLYAPPDSCACRPEMRLQGFAAMAPERPVSREAPPSARLLRGPAYEKVRENASASGQEPWPTYRCDGERSGRTKTQVPVRPQTLWQTGLGGQLTAPTIGAGKVFVARIDTCTVHAVDAASGKPAWRRTVGGVVDSPPTVYAGLVIFGSRDGHVYCLRAEDGELVWRFRAGPEERSLVAMQRVESVWPVHGSVLLHDGKIWAAAGRSPFLDGGIRLCALNPLSGMPVVDTQVFARDVQTFHTARAPRGGLTPPGLPDILSAMAGTVYMRWLGFDAKGEVVKTVRPHLFSTTGFLDDTWWHRTYWQYGTWMRGGFGGWPQAAQRVPAGRIMVAGDDVLYGYGRSKYDAGNGGNASAGHIGLVKRDYQDMGLIDPLRNPYRLYATARRPAARTGRTKPPSRSFNWQVSEPIFVRAMVLADKTLFIAGPTAGEENRGLSELRGASHGLLCAVATADGAEQARLPLEAAPVFDGLIAADRRLYLSTLDGRILCFGERR